MKNQNIRAIIFDFDGTLADTLDAIRAAVNNTMRHFGHPEKSRDEVRLAIGDGALKLISRVLPKDLATDAAYVGRVLDYYSDEYAHTFLMTDRCYPGMQEAIAGLVRRGYRLAILSNKPDRFIRELTELLFREDEICFAAGQTGLPVKPNPTSALLTASKLGVGLPSAPLWGQRHRYSDRRNAGMTTVGCTWGYRDARARRAGADFIIDRRPGCLSCSRNITNGEVQGRIMIQEN